ncbi:MAG: hypothetical protein EA350_09950 [Gemmatimonadales bacterium]|nr:MAG: hypothetical protein EA350_09950 [Gemmatimonadales bacterium]
MKTLRSFTFALLAGVMASLSVGTTPALAQGSGAVDASITDAATLESVLVGHERSADRSRSRLADLLAHEDVRAMAEARGIAMDRVEARAATLSDEEVSRVETMVDAAAEALDLSRTITISVSTVIIILLLLILIT